MSWRESGSRSSLSGQPVAGSGIRRTLDAQRAEISYQPVPTVSTAGGYVHHHAISHSKDWGAELLDSHAFQNSMAVVILLNGAVIGLEVDWPDFKLCWDIFEALFLVIFLAEVSFKMYVEGSLFFHPKEEDFWWNIFDVLIVGLGILDLGAELFHFQESLSGFGVTIFRMVRLLRVMRILRLVKVMKKLYLLAVGLVEASKAVIWVTILMSTVLYVFSIVLVKTVGDPSGSDPHYDFMRAHFSTIGDCMLTLFILMSSPNLPVYQEEVGLLDSRPLFCLFLVIFICFGSFGMIAMLTGVINESMFENNEMKKEEKREVHETMRGKLGERAADLFETLPLDSRGYARRADLKHIAVPAANLLDQTGIQIAHGDVIRFLELMDEEETGYVSLKDFVSMMERIAEGLSPLAIVEVQHYVALCHKKVTAQIDKLYDLERKHDKITEHMSDEVDRILKELTTGQTAHRDHLVEHIERQMRKTSDEVDRILEFTGKGQNENRYHLVEKIEAQMEVTSREVEHILAEVDKIYQVVIGQPTVERQFSNAELEPEVSRQMASFAAAVQSIVDVKFSALERQLAKTEGSEKCRSESTVLPANCKMEDVALAVQSVMENKFLELEMQLAQKDLATIVQRAIDKKFTDLERHLVQKDDLATEPKLMHEARSEPKLEKILSSLDVLCRKEVLAESFAADLSKLMQESKNAVACAARAQVAVNENVVLLTSQVSTLQREANAVRDSVQDQVLSSVAELGGDLISKISDLIATSLCTMKQELVFRKFHAGSSLSREETNSTLANVLISPSRLLARTIQHDIGQSDSAGTSDRFISSP